MRPLGRSGGDFRSSWDLRRTLQETWWGILTAVILSVPYTQGISSIIVVFVTVTRFATSYYGILLYLNSHTYIQYLRVFWGLAPRRRQLRQCRDALRGHCGRRARFSLTTANYFGAVRPAGAYGDRGTTQIVPATGSLHLGDFRIDRHHILRNTHSIFPSTRSHVPCQTLIYTHNLFGSSHAGTASYYMTLILCSSSQNSTFSRIPFGSHDSSTVPPHRDHVNIEMYLQGLITWLGRFTWRPRASELRDTLGVCDGTSVDMHSMAVFEQVCKQPRGPDQARLDQYFAVVNTEAVDWERGATVVSVCCTQWMLY